MGVTGLWRLIEPAGKPVPVETLENKVLAVDISIWLHQMVKGYQDAKGAPMPNAHLMGLFQRLCKLLYFRIKPVFVFDGGFPDLKKETIAKRQDNKSKYNSESERLKREIALLLGKKTAISTLLGKQISPKKNKQPENNDDIFKLPALPEKEQETESESEDEQNSSASTVDLHTVDLESENFKSMPIKEKYDLLVELKETRKMNSWGKIHTLPKKSDNFSDFQLQRLLKRRKVQECIEETEKEMGDGGMSLNDLESLLNEEGIDTKIESLPSRRIASNDTTRYLLISNVKQALENAKKKEQDATKATETAEPGRTSDSDLKTIQKHDEFEDDLQKAIQMSLECENEAETSACTSKTDDSWTSYLSDSDYSDNEDDEGFEQPDMSSAKAYIMQYSDLTHKAIDSIVAKKNKQITKAKEPKVDKIIEELNQEKSIIEDNIELMSSDDDSNIGNPDHNEGSSPFSSHLTNHIRRDEISPYKESLDCSDKQIEYDGVDNTQASIICVENAVDEIITLDTSADDSQGENESQTIQNNRKDEELSKSESSDDEFEEVIDNETKVNKPAIQLTLNMPDKIEDDIFADVFDVKSGEHDTSFEVPANHLIKEEKKSDTNIELETNLDLDNVKNHDETKTLEDKEIETIHNKDENKIKEANKVNNIKVNEINVIKVDVVPDVKKVSETTVDSNDNEALHNARQESYSPAVETPYNNTEPRNIEQYSTEKLITIATELENQEDNLLQEKGRLDRIGRNITEQMTKEAQELLQIFGIPYIVAPMEAEAQCAFLENVKLTDGTITDDSDIWLFGGRTVYKNFFNQKKHVLQFLSERIERSFNLTREQLVLLALLVGSDYTTGVVGVGPVTALEILASFPFNKKKLVNENNKQAQYQEIVNGLNDFKKWVRSGKRTDNVSLKKKLKNVSLSEDFPSVRVVQAYLEPNVEKSEEKFTWGELDITILRDYAKMKFGWSQNKLDEIIKPVLKRMVERKTQKTVDDYFKRKTDFQTLEDQMSKRVKAAVQKMGPDGPPSETKEPEQKATRKRKMTKSKKNNNVCEEGPSKEIEGVNQIIKTSKLIDTESGIDVKITKTERFQEIIPQREKDKKNLLENKLKAIEVFRKTKIDPKKKSTKRKLPVPKEKAELSESDSN